MVTEGLLGRIGEAAQTDGDWAVSSFTDVLKSTQIAYPVYKHSVPRRQLKIGPMVCILRVLTKFQLSHQCAQQEIILHDPTAVAAKKWAFDWTKPYGKSNMIRFDSRASRTVAIQSSSCTIRNVCWVDLINSWVFENRRVNLSVVYGTGLCVFDMARILQTTHIWVWLCEFLVAGSSFDRLNSFECFCPSPI
jgi:hypothetical protein